MNFFQAMKIVYKEEEKRCPEFSPPPQHHVIIETLLGHFKEREEFMNLSVNDASKARSDQSTEKSESSQCTESVL